MTLIPFFLFLIIMKKEKIGYALLIITLIAASIWFLISPPIEQAESYHNFADTRTILGIPNFWNVVSNLPFLIVGILGLYNIDSIAKIKTPYFVFFIGITLCFFGSSYYHWSPTSESLVWDRLPMTIGFMALVAIVINEYINTKKGSIFLWPLLIIGFLSIAYWVFFNDLKLYFIVQFYPLIAVPIIMILFNSRYNITSGYWILFLAYIIAKILEYYDTSIFNTLGFMSGHSLKHIFAAIGIFALYKTFMKRQLIKN